MSEIGLGIGRDIYQDGADEMEALYWYDQAGDRYQTPEEIARATQQQLERYRQRFGELNELSS